MSRHVKIKPFLWVKEYPVFGDCVGVSTVPDEVWAINPIWWNFSFETISEAEYGTLVAFGIDILDLQNDPPVTK